MEKDLCVGRYCRAAVMVLTFFAVIFSGRTSLVGRENFLENASQCREAMETLLLGAFTYRRAGGRAGRMSDEQQSR